VLTDDVSSVSSSLPSSGSMPSVLWRATRLGRPSSASCTGSSPGSSSQSWCRSGSAPSVPGGATPAKRQWAELARSRPLRAEQAECLGAWPRGGSRRIGLWMIVPDGLFSGSSFPAA